jgi:hypothetical protein
LPSVERARWNDGTSSELSNKPIFKSRSSDGNKLSGESILVCAQVKCRDRYVHRIGNKQRHIPLPILYLKSSPFWGPVEQQETNQQWWSIVII